MSAGMKLIEANGTRVDTLSMQEGMQLLAQLRQAQQAVELTFIDVTKHPGTNTAGDSADPQEEGVPREDNYPEGDTPAQQQQQQQQQQQPGSPRPVSPATSRGQRAASPTAAADIRERYERLQGIKLARRGATPPRREAAP